MTINDYLMWTAVVVAITVFAIVIIGTKGDGKRRK